MTMVGLSDNGLSQTWKRAQTSLIKMFLIKFDSMWKVKGLIVPLSNLWSRGRLGPIWTLFLDLPSLCASSLEVVVLGLFLAIDFQFVPKEEDIVVNRVQMCLILGQLIIGYVKTSAIFPLFYGGRLYSTILRVTVIFPETSCLRGLSP